MFKGVSGQTIGAQILGTDGASITTGTTQVYYTLDGGTMGTGTTATHEGQGFWSYSPGTAECNGNHCAFTFVNDAASAVDVTVQVYTSNKQAADRLTAAAQTMVYGTVGTGTSHTTTQINMAGGSISPSMTTTDMFKGRVLLFLQDSSSTALRCQGAPVDGNTTTAITFSTGNALTTAPASGDTFVIV